MTAARVSIVTGAARGIGKSIAATLASRGSGIAVWDIDGDGARAAAAELAEAHGVGTIGVDADVSNTASIDRALESTLAGLGPSDVLVNNAGIDTIGRFLDSDEDSWDAIIAVNLRGPIALCHRVVGDMVERGWGRVINMGSDAGKVGSSGEAVYSGTKGGIIAFSKALAREVAATGVTVNCVCPGPTDTALLDQVAQVDRRLYDGLARAIPLRRIAQPEDIAPVVAFLASEEAAYVTGQAWSVSGGLTMS